jgi:hypothetical protein
MPFEDYLNLTLSFSSFDEGLIISTIILYLIQTPGTKNKNCHTTILLQKKKKPKRMQKYNDIIMIKMTWRKIYHHIKYIYH